ncbi:hypothetical protein DFH07DRAFT_1005758 [Mycena maculata]|uniref:Uncharacterized protein n=1 Tax=Mycena maculata TaxID=230809 RepID=A0AAD7JQY7_9AGAR|nr:hypothetical protein DFH07DRAFT_1005758 [Mycena maculata]
MESPSSISFLSSHYSDDDLVSLPGSPYPLPGSPYPPETRDLGGSTLDYPASSSSYGHGYLTTTPLPSSSSGSSSHPPLLPRPLLLPLSHHLPPLPPFPFWKASEEQSMGWRLCCQPILQSIRELVAGLWRPAAPPLSPLHEPGRAPTAPGALGGRDEPRPSWYTPAQRPVPSAQPPPARPPPGSGPPPTFIHFNRSSNAPSNPDPVRMLEVRDVVVAIVLDPDPRNTILRAMGQRTHRSRSRSISSSYRSSRHPSRHPSAPPICRSALGRTSSALPFSGIYRASVSVSVPLASSLP